MCILERVSANQESGESFPFLAAVYHRNFCEYKLSFTPALIHYEVKNKKKKRKEEKKRRRRRRRKKLSNVNEKYESGGKHQELGIHDGDGCISRSNSVKMLSRLNVIDLMN